MLVRSGDGCIHEVRAPSWIARLLTRLPLGRMKLGPEDQASIEFGDKLRQWSMEGRLKGTWTKIPHEVGAVSAKRGGFRTAQARYAKQIAMGLVTGSADYVFVWDGGGGWIEMKSKSGSLTDQQRLFRQWAESQSVKGEMVRSADAGEAILRGWGVLI